MNLVIVESPSKAKTIKKYLGKDYVVKASKGHVVDLPKSKISVDVENNFKPKYEVTKRKVLSELKKDYKNADKLVLAVDLDREGEAIGWHLAQKLGAITESGKIKEGHKVERIVFSEITKDAIQVAIKHPRAINMNLVNAQQARRVLDRLVGYKLSPLLWKKISFGLSAGRVQSVALRLIVEKEEERRAFDPEEYWNFFLYIDQKSLGKQKVSVVLKEDKKQQDQGKKDEPNGTKFELFKKDKKKFKIESETISKEVLEVVKDKKLKIESIEFKDKKRNPSPPFITSTLQQTAINRLGYSSKKTMTVAQKLYERGYITYMRTDSVILSKQAIDSARGYIKSKFGSEYLPEKANFYKSKSKAAQEAHEAIRPVDFKVDEVKDMDIDMVKLYKLIKNRALASQMVPANMQQQTITGSIENYEFKATGSRIVFEGFLKAIGADKNDVILPKFVKGGEYNVAEIITSQHFTQPPARYSEASIIKKLEELGIGRPSTYSSIISTIISRKYVEKEGRYLFPTVTGEVVNKLLTKYFEDIVDYDFTSNMENTLDEIAEGKQDWIDVMGKFYEPFDKKVEENTEKIPRDEFTVIGNAPEDIKCPVCGSSMIEKLGRYGTFYSCSKWPDCKGMRGKDGRSEEDIAQTTESDEFKESYEPAPKTEDGRDYIYKEGRYGGFWAHPDYPKVKDAQPLKYKREKLIELYGEPPKTGDGKEFLLRKGRFGEFWAHPDYPNKKEIIKITKKSVR